MTHDVSHYELAEDASPIDRGTLRVWKLWVVWLRPVLLASILMAIGSAIVGTTIAKSGGIDNGFVAVWSPANYAGVHGAEAAWTRGILAQLATIVTAAALAGAVVLRRTHRAALVGAISGLLVVAAHLTLSHQWSSQPISAAPASYQASALISLWLLPLVTAAIGVLMERRRALFSR